MPRATAVLTILVLTAAAAAAGERWTADDLVTAETAREWSLSPAGPFAVWVRSSVAKVDGEETRVSNLWLTRLLGNTSAQLTRGDWTVSRPRFSPDGRHVAFLSDRELPGGGEESDLGKVQLWAIPVGGGEAFPVTRFDRPVRDFGWIDANALVVLAQESPGWWERERTQAEDDSVVVDDAAHEPPVRLFRVSLDGDTVRRLTTNTDWIDDLTVAPDGRRALVRAQQSLSWEFDQRVAPHTYLVDLGSGARQRLFADGALLPGEVRWTPDSAGFYFTNPFSRHPRYRTATITQLWHHDLATGTTVQVDLGWDRGLGGDWAPVPGGVVALLADGVRYRPALVQRVAAGWKRTDLEGAHVRTLASLDATADGATLLYERSAATAPPQWHAARLDGARLVRPSQLTDLNPGWKDKPTGRVEVVRWTGARDDEVEGLLHYPLEYEDGRRYPLILDIHGGPTGTDMDHWSQSWASPVILWRQRGAFVFQVNYHGSTGYGLDWVESIGGGRYYELEIPDIERGVDALVERGLADPERLATSGWSNGGILSAELITRTTRYKAASIGAADVEWFSDWANVDFGASFDNYYFGGPPWEIPQVYLDKSPFFRLPEVTTPTIVYTGTEDRNVPPHQSWSLFRALQQLGRTDVKLVLFPGEPHGLRDLAHQRRKIAEDTAWFDRYLFGGAPTRHEALKQGSPLAALLARAAAARSGAALGAEHDGTLVPETVPYEGMEVGRFEVTRAQWRAFEPGLAIVAGDEDLPVTGIPYDRAAAYAEWLARTTGRAFRLPTVAEAETLAGKGGNTLDRWAGYEPNPEDATTLRAEAGRLGPGALLLPVGSLPGSGEAMVFDLDGNAAEWATAPTGGKAVGPSADRPSDPRAWIEPDPTYVGLRVVVGPAR